MEAGVRSPFACASILLVGFGYLPNPTEQIAMFQVGPRPLWVLRAAFSIKQDETDRISVFLQIAESYRFHFSRSLVGFLSVKTGEARSCFPGVCRFSCGRCWASWFLLRAPSASEQHIMTPLTHNLCIAGVSECPKSLGHHMK